jgi:hypothetical protein
MLSQLMDVPEGQQTNGRIIQVQQHVTANQVASSWAAIPFAVRQPWQHLAAGQARALSQV